MIKDKLILTDCDGVLLDWEWNFHKFMHDKGYTEYEYDNMNRYSFLSGEERKNLVTEYNNSSYIRFLPPMKDSVRYVKQLHKKRGYVFGVITSLSSNPYTRKLREENLKEHFGNIFDFVWSIETMADKTPYLTQFKDSQCWWIEDKIENAELGTQLGLRSVLLRHEAYTKDYCSDTVAVVDSWKDIYTIIK